MTTMRPVSGCTPNWMLQPPVSTPTSRITAIPMLRRRWYSRSVRVSAGATVTESPVCTPVSYTHLRAHETRHDLVCRLLLEKKKNTQQTRLTMRSKDVINMKNKKKKHNK